PYTLHPTPCTLHSTPCTLHPTPCTLHPTPYTLHSRPLDGAQAGNDPWYSTSFSVYRSMQSASPLKNARCDPR
ncbi:hypothetical protein T484DRAFT_1618204, partial [Baffinella frigidus]